MMEVKHCHPAHENEEARREQLRERYRTCVRMLRALRDGGGENRP